jgi:hypothetical protein
VRGNIRLLVFTPKIFQEPTPVEDAVAFVDALLAAQGVHLAPLGPEWPRLRQLCIEKKLKGNAAGIRCGALGR